jgi:ribosome recycling factor
MTQITIDEMKSKMVKTIDALHKEFSGLRTGRATVSLLEPLIIEAYGSTMPITQVGTISAPEATMLTIQVWDKSMVSAVEKSIMDSDLGLNPVSDGQLIRVPLPKLSQERRLEITKIAKKYAENARVSIRNARREGMDLIKLQEKEGKVSEDESHQATEKIQTLTNDYIKKIDDLLVAKEADIMQV